ncbi:MAG: hypothetical protein JJE12_12395 [Anaerolineales bacterium]|nr:hypothetical protein [Anaerolineales bacterium]
MKRPDGVTAIAVWFFVEVLLALFLTCLFSVLIFSGFIKDINEPVGEFLVVFTLVCGGIFSLFFGLLSVFAGWGLLQMKQWARWLAIILGIFSLFAFPIGTVIGALIIWYLLKEDVREAFEMAEDGLLPEEPVVVEPEDSA